MHAMSKGEGRKGKRRREESKGEEVGKGREEGKKGKGWRRWEGKKGKGRRGDASRPSTLVRVLVKHIHSLFCLRPSLFVPKNEVNPLIEVC